MGGKHTFADTCMASAIKPTCLPTDFVPFVEIMDVDWVSASASGDGNQNVPATPKKFAKPDVTNSKGKRKIAFDPFADSGVTSSLSSEDKAKSDSQDRAGRK